ncbi:MAG: hypothetical protein ACLFO1_00035 [Spirochaetaceae bacterium]
MKRRYRFLVVGFSLLALLLPAVQLFAVSIVNDGDGIQYFYVSERTPKEIRATIADQRELENFIQSNMFRMRYIPPGAVRTGVSVPAEGGTVVVLHVTPGATEYEVSLHEAEARTEEIAPAPEGEPRLASVQALDVRLPREVVRIDNRYVDWERIEAQATFSEATAPDTFVRELPEGTETLAVTESLTWPKAGTQLDAVKAVRGDSALYLYASATREYGEGTSIFLYAYPDRDAERPAFTLEIPFSSRTNAVLLWQPTRETPRVVGDFARAGFLVEARVFLNALPGGMSFVERETSSFDLATAYHLPNRFEEFFHTTLYLSEIPRRGAGM